jgi:hypothetical protein
MKLRFEAQSQDDYESIYHSSHRLSTLRRSFPSLKEYVSFASEQLSGQITITAFELLAEQIFVKKAYVLCKVSMSVQNRSETFIEVAELMRSVMGWRFLRCARLPVELLPADPTKVDMKQLSSHPAAVIY